MAVIIGTSGWQYRDWRGRFYPPKLPQRLWLEHYVEFFATVESNNAFYRLPELETFRKWRDRTPPDFRWAVKASRFLTHIKRLREPEEPVGRLMERAAGLEHKLDTILLQLPPTLKADAELLRDCLAQFPAGIRVAVEPRHDSWWTDEIRALLERTAPPSAGPIATSSQSHRCGAPPTGATSASTTARTGGPTGPRRCSSGPTGWRPPAPGRGRARLLQQRPRLRRGRRRGGLRRRRPRSRRDADPGADGGAGRGARLGRSPKTPGRTPG